MKMHWDIKLRTGLQLGIQLDNYWLIANWKEAPPQFKTSIKWQNIDIIDKYLEKYVLL